MPQQQLVALDFLLRILMLPSPKRPTAQADATTYGTFPNRQDAVQSPPDEPQRRTTSNPPKPPPPSPTDPLLPSSTRKPQPHTHRHPILTLLTTPRMLAAILADFTQSVVLTGLETILPLRIKLLFHYNSMQVALVFLVLTIPSFAAPAVGLWSDKVGAKIVIPLGFILLAPLLVLLRLVDRGDDARVALLMGLLLLIGVALNFMAIPAFAEAMYVVDEAESGVWGERGGYAAGSLVGPFVGGLAADWIGWDGLTLASGVLCGLCALPCLYATGGRRLPVRLEGGTG